MARVYATPDDVAGWVGDYPPANVTVLLARASLDVDAALVGAVYPNDEETGLPTDTAVAAALRDAVCAQVDSWWPRDAKTGQRTTGRLVTVTPPPTRGLADDAVSALRSAGLLPVTAVRYW